MTIPVSPPAWSIPTDGTTTEATPPDSDVGAPVDDTATESSADGTEMDSPEDDADIEGPEATPDIKAPPSTPDTNKSAVRDREALLSGKHSTGPKQDTQSKAAASCTTTDFSVEPPIYSVVALNRIFGRVRLTEDQVLRCQGQSIEVCAIMYPFTDTVKDCAVREIVSGTTLYVSNGIVDCAGTWATLAGWKHETAGRLSSPSRYHVAEDGSCQEGEADDNKPISRDLEMVILAYQARIPATENTNDYQWDAKSPGEIANIITLMKAANSGTPEGRLEADRGLEEYDYELEFITDTTTGRNHLLLYELNPFNRGWGLYVLRYDATTAPANTAVEAPHPIHDELSVKFGIKTFIDLDGKMFAMAGTHRYNSTEVRDPVKYPKSRISDMARSYESLFHKVHTNFTTGHPAITRGTWSPTHVAQVHGFEAREGYPEVVLSNGSCQPHSKLRTFAEKVRYKGVSAGVFEGDATCSKPSRNYPAVGATMNPQAKHTRKKGGYFYHVEAVRSLRFDPARYHLVAKAFGETLFEGGTGMPAKIGPAPGFDPNATAAYARTHARNYNGNYWNWNHRGPAVGGDSPNFVSQALAAGGWQWYEPGDGELGDHQSSNYWYYRGNAVNGNGVGATTWSWVNAETWSSFARKSGRVTKIKYLSDVGLGDVVQFALPDSKTKENRSMIVTGFDSSGPLVSYHSPDVYNAPLWSLYQSHNLNWADSDVANVHRPGMAFSAWRTVSVSDHAHRDSGVSQPGVPTTQARLELDSLALGPEGSMEGYDRSQFPHWNVVNGCNTRQTVLRRDGRAVRLGTGCQPASGIWFSEYDGLSHTSPDDVEIDHVVPLAEAWRSGANAWTRERRSDFANDLAGPQLRAVTGTINNSKRDKDPVAWVPPRAGAHCGYAKHWIHTKFRWGLSVQIEEKDALRTMLGRCPD
ncbi:amidase domain-containing protein [Amycolatopsis roodepoortensis]|uniref:amidase domain-containing protein n=1 Tax=Amycolatopsis roodepoortensis TaxID=700274 RepID=UPI00214BDC52|nr:amidase domain-containing protein [Amycolatopsis roodepoortensis]UUV30733.1 amidase domain-containing protein [Amycolatopsis roodepoortensis]